MINENDTTTTDEISFGNNDFLAAQVAILLAAERLLLLTDAEGVFTADPRADPDARLVPEVDRVRAARAARHRPRDLAARLRRDALEGGGRRDGHRRRDPDGDRQRSDATGAMLAAADGRAGRHAVSRPLGPLLELQAVAQVRQAGSRAGSIDAGAARALREGGTSLLPVGIVEVAGEFDAGDAVEVAFDGELVGKGICNYSAVELRRVRGLKSADVRERLPRATEEAVHRDYFVLA